MKKILFLILLIIIFNSSFQANPCKEIVITPHQPNQVNIIRNDTFKCIYFSFDNPLEGNIILKLAKSNSFTSYIYVYSDESKIDFNKEKNDFSDYDKKYHIGEDFFKELKIEELQIQKYYFIIYEKNFNFNDELVIYNDKFSQNNYYEINQISKGQKNEFNFKYEYTEENPIIIHFKTNSNNIKYLNYQFINIKNNGKTSLYLYENNFESGENPANIKNEKEYSYYVSLKSDTDYYIKIVTDGEIDLILEFLESKILKINPDDIFEEELITKNEYYFYIEKELIQENDEYFNEFTVKLEAFNLNNLIIDISTNTCDGNSEQELLNCINNNDSSQKTIIKRDIDIPYIYHIYYSFNKHNFIVIKIQNKNSLSQKQRIIIESSGGNDLIDNKSEKVFTNNKGYLYPVYLNISISDINDENNKNKNRLLIINTNTTSAIKVFYNDNTFKNENIDIKKDEYIKIENYFYGFDFNEEKTKTIFGNRKYFTILIYSPWESSPISFQLTFLNNNIDNFKYFLGDIRPTNSQIEINLKSTNEKYYFIGQYNQFSTNILFNEVVYGKISAKYKFFNNNDKISRLIYNETANGDLVSNWYPIRSRIDIIEITCISPALLYMHFIEDQAIKINDITLEKGLQKYIFLNNTNTYNLLLSDELKQSQNINIEVFVVSQVNDQLIDIEINKEIFHLSKEKDNNILRYNTKEKNLETFSITGKGTATLIRVKIGVNVEEKKIAYYNEYKKTEGNNKLSKKININISNNNDKSIKLCHNFNFEEENYIYIPKNENCFELNKNEKTTLSMYNPWDKYLINDNKLYKESDLFYVMIYAEDESAIGKLDIKSEPEIIDINDELKQNEYINIGKSKNNIIKSPQLENHLILIQFSPNSYNNYSQNEDKFIIKSQMDEIIQEGIIYNKQNRTYVIFNDQLIYTFLELDIQSNNKYDIKYSIIPNTNNITEDNINDNYNIEFINTNSETPYIKIKPLFRDKDIEYSVYLSFNKSIELSGVSNLKKLQNDENNIFIFNEKKRSSEDSIKLDLKSEILSQINNKEWQLNVLAEEKEIYNIAMSYDVIKGGENKGGEKKEENNGNNSAGTAFLLIFIILIILGGVLVGIFIYNNKKKFKNHEALLKDIDNVNLSLEDQAKENKQNYEEGVI